MTQRIKTAVFGANGRMGRKNMEVVLSSPELELTGALDRKESPDFGNDTGILLGKNPSGVKLTDDVKKVLEHAAVMIDFSAPEGTLSHLDLSTASGTALVIGTTGLSPGGHERILEASKKIPIVYSGNFSLGVNVLLSLIRQAAKTLEGFDIEIVEHHHNQKKDAPSGTAIMLGKAAAAGRGLDFEKSLVTGRNGQVGARTKDEIGMLALRGGGIIGRHEVYLVSGNETVELSHLAHDRDAFTSGVVRAVKWVAGKKPGLYSMTDVLGLAF